MKKLITICLIMLSVFTINAQTFTKYVDNSQRGLGFAYTLTLKATLIKMASSGTVNTAGNPTEYSVELVRVDLDKNKGWYSN
jgi:hypothetical protein